ncbi:MAG: uncharacterized protein A8A55_1274 [Amphiamblys sp. WSBS2006]|nr:MAG: uncharacterized protein A8A55_1274 [Amphiamblys sp. WSBS2006]
MCGEKRVFLLKVQKAVSNNTENAENLFLELLEESDRNLRPKAITAIFISELVFLYNKAVVAFGQESKTSQYREHILRQGVFSVLETTRKEFYIKKEDIPEIIYYSSFLKNKIPVDSKVFGHLLSFGLCCMLEDFIVYRDTTAPRLTPDRKALVLKALGESAVQMLKNKKFVSRKLDTKEKFFLYLSRLQETAEGRNLCMKNCYFFSASWNLSTWIFEDSENIEKEIRGFVASKKRQSYYRIVFLLDLFLERMGDILSFRERTCLVNIHFMVIDLFLWEREHSHLSYSEDIEETTCEKQLQLLYTAGQDHHPSTMGVFFHRVKVFAMSVLHEVSKRVELDEELERKWKVAFVKLCSGDKMGNIFRRNGLLYAVGFILCAVIQKSRRDTDMQNILFVLQALSRVPPGRRLQDNINIVQSGNIPVEFVCFAEEGQSDAEEAQSDVSVNDTGG